ncbi:MAG: uroporphyrinogen decarboxylase, partial [Chloroflexi bacterium]|nr:uroporphyrinogen decarboxylase [Chloroflexota bacterium]
TFKSKELVKEVIDFSTDFVLRFYEPLLASGTIEMISLADPTASGDLISRKQFQEFALPYLQKVTGKMRSRGIATLLHICGDTSDRLDLLAQTGADCISLDHKVDLARAKRELGSQVCIGGNVNPVAVLNNGTAGQVEEVCRRCVQQAAEGGSFVLMPGCDIPPSVPLENIQTFVRVAHSWKAS